MLCWGGEKLNSQSSLVSFEWTSGFLCQHTGGLALEEAGLLESGGMGLAKLFLPAALWV